MSRPHTTYTFVVLSVNIAMPELEGIYLQALDSTTVPFNFQLEDGRMATVDISASSILSEMVSIFTDARLIGLKVPSFVNTKFRNKLASPQYRDALSAARLNPLEVGYVLGNKHRWDQGLCKYFTLRFLKFYMQRTPKSKFDPDVFLLQYLAQNAPKYQVLPGYDSRLYGPRYVDEGPSIFFGSKRYLTFKIKTEYPNVSKGLDEYQLRWINMRYSKSLRSGNVQLEPVPQFKAKRKAVGKALETRGQIRDQPGEIANFSYCSLANAFKDLCFTSLDMLVGNTITSTDSSFYIPFDIINLLQKRNTKFRVVTYAASADGPLFSPVGVTVSAEQRINGDMGIYFLYGSKQDIQDLVEAGEILQAHCADSFRLSQHNLYGEVEEGDPVYGILFEVSEEPSLVSESGVALWEAPVQIISYELLGEPEIIESLGV